MIAFELEVLATKYDRFAWDRDRHTAAREQNLRDWMDALSDYPLEEIQKACRLYVIENPNKMPNEGHIHSIILKGRKKLVERAPKPRRSTYGATKTDKERARVQALVEANFPPIKRFGTPNDQAS